MSDFSIPPTRCCTKCGKEFPATTEYFYKKERGLYGLFSWCKTCHIKLTTPSAYKWIIEHPARAAQHSKNYAERHPEKKKEFARRRDKKRRAEYDKNRRLKDPEKHRERLRKWRTDNPHKVMLKNQRRAARKRNLPNTFTVADWQRCLSYFRGCCAYCGNPPGLLFEMKITADHFIPLNATDCPGTVPENIVPTCLSCNSSKRHSDFTGWANQRFGPRKAAQILRRIEAFFAWVKEQDKQYHS